MNIKKVIQIDTRQKMNQKHHKAKEKWFLDNGYEILRSKLAFGDYAFPYNMSAVVDTKQSCSELYSNLIQQHQRFHNECENAHKYGIKLYVLVENKDGITCPEDIRNWKNPQMYRYWKEKRKAEKTGQKPPKPPASNVQLLKIMHSMSRDYGVEFLFCRTEDAGAKIVELLGGGDG